MNLQPLFIAPEAQYRPCGPACSAAARHQTGAARARCDLWPGPVLPRGPRGGSAPAAPLKGAGPVVAAAAGGGDGGLLKRPTWSPPGAPSASGAAAISGAPSRFAEGQVGPITSAARACAPASTRLAQTENFKRHSPSSACRPPGGLHSSASPHACNYQTRGRRPPATQVPSARQLARIVATAGSLQELLSLVTAYRDELNLINLTSSFVKAVRLLERGGAAAAARQVLGVLSARLRARAWEWGTQGYSNVLWACGKAGYEDAELVAACLAGIAASASAASVQSLSNALYGVAQWQRRGGARADAALGSGAPALLLLLAALTEKLEEATAQAVSNALWAAACLRLPVSEEQVRALAARLVATLYDAQPQEAANTLWAAATLGVPLPLPAWRAAMPGAD